MEPKSILVDLSTRGGTIMYVITGATGNTGRIIVNGLLARGEKVRAMARSAEHLKPEVAKGAEAFTGHLQDSDTLARALDGAKAAYLMIPPDIENPDFRKYQDQLVESIGKAAEKSGLSHAVVLSSVGADKTERTGPVLGLHNLEERLNGIAGLNVLALRPGYFMENTFPQAALIKMFGMTAGPLRGDLKLPMIAARDIGEYATKALLKLDFQGKQTRELLGQRDLSYNDVASIIGKATGQPELKYSQLPDEQVRGGMMAMGMSGSIVDLILEMGAAMNSGYMKELEPRSAENTTPTSYETFVTEEFVPNYRAAAA
jgi:uncharacterized protein YbjT (DUF2867 family)